jgi:hypothetical protein
MSTITNVLSSVEFGSPVHIKNLSMFPLLLSGEPPAGYLTLDEALAQGWAKVTEVSDSGSVPTLRVSNAGAKPVLIMDGEELVGAKQNRIVNLTILVAAKSTIEIPVSCVEAGRWGGRNRHFATAPRAHYAAARAQKLACVNRSMSLDGSHRADQGAIWHDIEMKSERLCAMSETSAMDSMYEAAGASLAEFEEGLQPLERQAGAMFAINGVIVGLDLFDSPATWRKLMPKLVHSYGLDALDRTTRRGFDKDEEGHPLEAQPDPAKFLRAVRRAKATEFPAIGLGTDLRIDGRALAGGALAVDDGVVHLVAFAM